MLPEGKLYVPGAEETAPAMARLVAAAREAGIVHVASADDHELTDPEISDEPDFRNTYPPHCLRGTPGAEKVPETKQADPLPLSLVPFPPGLVPGLIEDRREILLLKKNFDVFTNPNAEALLAALDPDEIVVFGVATAGCGVGAAWIVSALPPTVPFVTVELDPTFAKAAAELFAEDENVRVLEGDWHEVMPAEAPFDLLFYDGGGKQHPELDGEQVVSLLAPGATIVMDDLTPHRGQTPGSDPVRDFWLDHPELAALELLTTPETAAIVGTRRG